MAVRVRGVAWRRAAAAGVSLIAMTHGSAARETLLSLVPLCDEDAIDVLPGAAPEPVRVSIAPGPLEPALAILAEQTGLKLAYRTAMTQGLTTRGAEGAFRPRDALARTLEGTGLSCRSAGSSTITLENPTYVQLGGAATEATLEEIAVEGSGNGGRAAGQPPPTGTIGQPPRPFAGGQVASGGRVGFLGNRSVFDTPFTQNNYTEQLIRDQQALTVQSVLENNPALSPLQSPYGVQPNVFVRGFILNARDFAFDGLYGITSRSRPAIEGIERVEVLNGPGAFLYGFPPSGSIAGVINFVPKRAPELPITRVTGQYLSDANFGGAVDVARRFGDGNALGVRINGAYRDGATPIDRNEERFGVLALALDYRGERLRLSADFGYQDFQSRASPQFTGALQGTTIPRAPDLTRNLQQSWERHNTDHAFAVGRAEYDLTDDLTLFGAIGGSRNNIPLQRFTTTFILDPAGTLLQRAGEAVDGTTQWTAETGIRARFTTGFIDHSAAVVGTHYEAARSFAQTPLLNFTSNLYDPVVLPRPFFARVPRTHVDPQLDGIAVTDTMSVLDGRVQVIAGGRFQRAQSRTTTAAGVVTADYDETASTPLAALIVKPLQNLSLYASYAEGFGFGPTAPLGAINAGAVFPPVITTQIETGTKLDLGTLGATVAFYEITQPSGFLDPITNLFGLNGEQRNRGMDVNVFGEPVPGVRVLGGVSLLDGRQTKTVGGRFDGNVAPGVPDLQLNVGGEVDLPPWLAPGVTLNGRMFYVTRQFFDLANTQSIPDWTRFDLGLRYTFVVNDTPLVARVNVLNVTGNNYWASAGAGQLALGTPRTVLFSFTADL